MSQRGRGPTAWEKVRPQRETTVFETLLPPWRRVDRSSRYGSPCKSIGLRNGRAKRSSTGVVVVGDRDDSSRAERPRLGPPTSRPDSLFGKLATRLSVPLRARRVPRLRGTCHRFRSPPTSFHPLLASPVSLQFRTKRKPRLQASICRFRSFASRLAEIFFVLYESNSILVVELIDEKSWHFEFQITRYVFVFEKSLGRVVSRSLGIARIRPTDGGLYLSNLTTSVSNLAGERSKRCGQVAVGRYAPGSGDPIASSSRIHARLTPLLPAIAIGRLSHYESCQTPRRLSSPG